MSVFSDFQRMWVQRFPQSSLSDAWEQDVRASLERHKQKIAELSKELEQETLYVEYLERLLGDVEKYREAGGDPSTLFEANSPASAANLLSRPDAAGGGGGELLIHDDGRKPPEDENQIIKAAPGSNQQQHQAAPTSDTSDADGGGAAGGSVETGAAAAAAELVGVQLRARHNNINNNNNNNNNNSPLNQCINELTSNLHSRRCVSELVAASSSSSAASINSPSSADHQTHQQSTATANGTNQQSAGGEDGSRAANGAGAPEAAGGSGGASGQEDAPEAGPRGGVVPARTRSASQSEAAQPTPQPQQLLSSPSHFVTVIEVKESQSNGSGGASAGASEHKHGSEGDEGAKPPVATPANKPGPGQNSYENVLINTGGGVSVGGGGRGFGGSMENLVEGLAGGGGGSNGTGSSGSTTSSTFLDPKHPKQPPDRSNSDGAAAAGTFTGGGGGSSISERTSQLLATSASAAADLKKKVPPRPPPKYVRRAAPVEPPTVPTLAMQNLRGGSTRGGAGGGGGGGGESSSESAAGTPEGGSGGGSPAATTAAGGGGSSSSLDRNVKPSEIYRQKSSDSLDVKLAAGRSRLPKSDSLKSKASSSTDSPTGSLGKVGGGGGGGSGTSPTGSLGKLPTVATATMSSSGSNDSPTGSLGKMQQQQQQQQQHPYHHHHQQSHHVGSKESLASTGGGGGGGGEGTGTGSSAGGIGTISERIKSYESISSLSSDSMRAGGYGTHQQHLQQQHQQQQQREHQREQEHYYDTVPLDNGDGDYVYIQPGGGVGTGTTGSSSSRDDISSSAGALGAGATGIENASTLLMPSHPRSHNSSQTSVQLEPESPGRSSNYVNIEYFIHSSSQHHENRSSSLDSDGEGDGVPPVLMRAISTDTEGGVVGSGVGLASAGPGTPDAGSGLFRKISNGSSGNRNTIIRHIVTSIITSETLYVECLNKMKQYMKAIRATLTTSQPVISEEEFQTIFFKIEDLHEVHGAFLAELQGRLDAPDEQQPDGLCVGEPFRRLASQIHLYGAFLHNYGRAIDTVKMCSTNSAQFKEIVSNIVFKNQNEQKLSLEELLHKPVARVQKNALVLEDLLNQTPEQHPDYHPLRQASKTIRNFLSEFNVVQTRSMFPSEDKALRRLVKNSFIVELADGHRKLRHLFLFNDVIACAKYKAVGRSGGDRNGFEFELKWFIPLRDILICEESANDPKETSPINIVHLKSQACTVRDQILLDEKDRPGGSSRAGDKHRKKLADLEAQLVLASPNLVFKIGNKATGKTLTFFLSSDFERTQWIESILSLQQSCNLPGHMPVQIYDLQAWITACQALIKTEMGSYLMRNARDESLLVGDLHLTIQGLAGYEQPSDLFVCVEIDSYGHYFRKAKTKLVCRSATPQWNESFVLELEGSQNLRILLYQDDVQRPILRAKHILKLSRSWLQEASTKKVLKLSETLSISTVIRFVPGEVTLRRVPTSKPGALFGAKLQQVIKREKRDIPFIVSACLREVERRGMTEVGIYRVSGSASDVAKLKKSFETNAYEAEQLLKEVDIHSVTGILKSYLRDLPEALFTDQYYPKFFEAFNRHSNLSESARIQELQRIFFELPQPNKATINLLLDHLMRVHQQEIENKMSLHNLAMVFGPTLLRPGPTATKQKDLLESSTADVMTQAGILYSFLQARLK